MAADIVAAGMGAVARPVAPVVDMAEAQPVGTEEALLAARVADIAAPVVDPVAEAVVA